MLKNADDGPTTVIMNKCDKIQGVQTQLAYEYSHPSSLPAARGVR